MAPVAGEMIRSRVPSPVSRVRRRRTPVSASALRTRHSALLLLLTLLTLMLPACDDKAGKDVVSAKIGGKTFFLEVAADDPTRLHGLMERTHIDDDGGMIFVFPPSLTIVQGFWMKNCLTDMDIIFLDGSGRVLATHTMKVPPPMKPGEDPKAYDESLPRYSSNFPSPIAIEVQPGMVKKLGVKPGDLVKFDSETLDALKKRAT